MDKRIQENLNYYNKLKEYRTNWDTYNQDISEFILPTRSYFNQTHERGENLNYKIFDSTGMHACKVLASSIIGMLFPSAKQSFIITAPQDMTNPSSIVDEYYNKVTYKIHYFMDSYKSGLMNALTEYALEMSAFSTAGVTFVDDDSFPLIYKSQSLVNLTIDEGKNGYVDTFFYEYEYTIKRIVNEYGYENCSYQVRELYDNEEYTTKIRILHVVRPRDERERKGKMGVLAMPYLSLHIDMQHKHIMKESGFEDQPTYVGRFTKAIGEIYGRGPGQDAISDIIKMQVVWEWVTMAIEKQLDPPIALLDGDALGNNVIDTSAGGVTELHPTGIISGNPIIPLQTVGNIQDSAQYLDYLKQQVSDHFYIDRLLDFNNQTQMTLGEAQMRNDMRYKTFVSFFFRQFNEIFSPLIENSFNRLWRKGYLGVEKNSEEEMMVLERGEEPFYLPEEVLELVRNNKNAYDIRYISPAFRMVQMEKTSNLINFVNYMGQMAQLKPETLDYLDEGKNLDNYLDSLNLPKDLMHSMDEVQEIRAQRQEQMQQQQQLAAMESVSKSAKNVEGIEGLGGMLNG